MEVELICWNADSLSAATITGDLLVVIIMKNTKLNIQWYTFPGDTNLQKLKVVKDNSLNLCN